MGRKVERWQEQRAAAEMAPDLVQYRPAGPESVPLAAIPEVASAMLKGNQGTRPRPKGWQKRKQPGEPRWQRRPNDQLEGGGNYRPAYQVAAARDRFLQLYAERGTMVECCRLAGISYSAIQHALEKDEGFARAFAIAEQEVLEKLEREAMRRAVDGTVVRSRRFWHGELVGEDIRTEYSDNLLMLLLRAKAPQRYRDSSLVTINQVIKAVSGFDPSEVLGRPPSLEA